ncbi:DUF6461 domain-containing protein [Microbispora hainanensis]|uniref:DUF6461 domain-containing protein n=1 Tax=Microbispora hainanensis TaxID=568844 RepID=UPI003CC797CC
MVHATARTPGTSPEDYAWQAEGPLGSIYTITLVRGVEEHEALRRLGAAPEHDRPGRVPRLQPHRARHGRPSSSSTAAGTACNARSSVSCPVMAVRPSR